ncbi:MAG: septum formation protein Maf [Ekhidna sp.]|nr:septum formation protein Maf [Ekhidna sp.]MBC6426961.1 septum formation protein Maf [Ekhidna sp.]
MKLSNELILGSGSPRRKQLLQDAGFKFQVKTIPFDEVFPNELEPENVAEFLAIGKNREQRKNIADQIVLTADTVVIHKNKILGKPNSSKEAIQTIKSLSGDIHEVITGVCISTRQKLISFSSGTEVKLKKLSSEEIEFYVTNFQPMDKAGSYAIQEWIGLIGVEWIKGAYYNVVGLPIAEVYEILLKEFR